MKEELHPSPVDFTVEPQLTERNRVTCAFRLILAIPHLILVGGPGGLGAGPLGWRRGDNDGWFGGFGATGVLGAVAAVMAIISWFAIVITGRQPRGLWDSTRFYLTWRSRAVAYTALLRDEYPPFGDGSYPTTLTLPEFPTRRSRLTVFFRLIMVIPHIVAAIFFGIAWIITAVVGWFAILLTGSYPEVLYNFAVSYLRWSLRLEAYVLLMHDEYPPVVL